MNSRQAFAALVLVQALLIAAGLVLPPGLAYVAGSLHAVAVTLTVVLGAALGIHFACCATLWSRSSQPATRSARCLYAADSAGAALAAMLAAAGVIPVAGHAAAAGWAAAFAAVALTATLLTTPGPRRRTKKEGASGTHPTRLGPGSLE